MKFAQKGFSIRSWSWCFSFIFIFNIQGINYSFIYNYTDLLNFSFFSLVSSTFGPHCALRYLALLVLPPCNVLSTIKEGIGRLQETSAVFTNCGNLFTCKFNFWIIEIFVTLWLKFLRRCKISLNSRWCGHW